MNRCADSPPHHVFMNLFDPIIPLWEPVAKLFRDDNFLQRMLDFEAALARCGSDLRHNPLLRGELSSPQNAASNYSINKNLAEAAALAGNLAVPLVKQLKALVAPTIKMPLALCIAARPVRTP